MESLVKKATTRLSEIEALGLDEEEEIMDMLGEVASRYGNVTRVWQLPESMRADRNISTYLIDFELISEAVSASHDMECPLAGLSTVVVSMSKPPRPEGVDPVQGNDVCYLLRGEIQ